MRKRNLQKARQELHGKRQDLPVFGRKDLPTGKSFPSVLPLISNRLQLAWEMLRKNMA